MQEREKFNIVKASMAAEGMLFYPVSNEGIVTGASRNAYAAEIAMPVDASVMAMADGVVIATYFDPQSKGYAIIMQHDNGFVSRYSALRTLMVKQSESVPGGKVIALSPLPPAGKSSQIKVEIWHNGIHVKPYEFISSHRRLSAMEKESSSDGSLSSSLSNQNL